MRKSGSVSTIKHLILASTALALVLSLTAVDAMAAPRRSATEIETDNRQVLDNPPMASQPANPARQLAGELGGGYGNVTVLSNPNSRYNRSLYQPFGAIQRQQSWVQPGQVDATTAYPPLQAIAPPPKQMMADANKPDKKATKQASAKTKANKKTDMAAAPANPLQDKLVGMNYKIQSLPLAKNNFEQVLADNTRPALRPSLVAPAQWGTAPIAVAQNNNAPIAPQNILSAPAVTESAAEFAPAPKTQLAFLNDGAMAQAPRVRDESDMPRPVLAPPPVRTAESKKPVAVAMIDDNAPAPQVKTQLVFASMPTALPVPAAPAPAPQRAPMPPAVVAMNTAPPLPDDEKAPTPKTTIVSFPMIREKGLEDVSTDEPDRMVKTIAPAPLTQPPLQVADAAPQRPPVVKTTRTEDENNTAPMAPVAIAAAPQPRRNVEPDLAIAAPPSSFVKADTLYGDDGMDADITPPPATIAMAEPEPEKLIPVTRQPVVTPPVSEPEPEAIVMAAAPKPVPVVPAPVAAPVAAVPAPRAAPLPKQLIFAASAIDVPDNAVMGLDNLAAALAQQGRKVQIRSYASAANANTSDARRVSLKRALAVRNYLVDKGVPSNRIEVRALGYVEDAINPPDRVEMDF